MRPLFFAALAFALLASPRGAWAQVRTRTMNLTLSPEFAAGLDAPRPEAFATPTAASGLDPEIVRLQLEQPRLGGLGRRIGGRWLTTIGAALLASGTLVAALARPFTCYNTGERVRTTTILGGLTAIVGLAFTIGGGIRLSRSAVGHQRQPWGRRIGYALAALLLGGITSGVLITDYIIRAVSCD